MSYEGYSMFLCARGHASVYGCHDTREPRCRHCGEPPAYECMVDQTNGHVEDDPSTHEPDMEEIGFDDHWGKDHYGNKFAAKIRKYKPLGDRWHKLQTAASGGGK